MGRDFVAKGLDPRVSLQRRLCAEHEGAVVSLLHVPVIHHLDTLHVTIMVLGKKKKSRGVSVTAAGVVGVVRVVGVVGGGAGVVGVFGGEGVEIKTTGASTYHSGVLVSYIH